MKPRRHRCQYCGTVQFTYRVISSAGMSSEWINVCRSTKKCEARVKASGTVFYYWPANPPKKRKGKK
jgi:hypothetical protein